MKNSDAGMQRRRGVEARTDVFPNWAIDRGARIPYLSASTSPALRKGEPTARTASK